MKDNYSDYHIGQIGLIHINNPSKQVVGVVELIFIGPVLYSESF